MNPAATVERVVFPTLLTLYGSSVNWAEYVKGRPDHPDAALPPPSFQLRWVVRPTFGIPLHPYTVWVRPSTLPKLTPIALKQVPAFAGRAISLDLGPAPQAIVQLDLTVAAATTVVAIGVNRTGKFTAYATTSAPGNQTLTLRCDEMVRVWITAAAGTVLHAVRGISANAFAALPDWHPIELVGFPVVPAAWAGTGYDLGAQGPLAAPLSPMNAALRRLDAGAPPAGWLAQNDLHQAIAAWQAPSHMAFLKELNGTVIPPLVEMFAATLHHPSMDQVSFVKQHAVTAPGAQSGTKRTDFNSTIGLSPLQTVVAAAASDTFASLGLGFGTAIGAELLKTVHLTPAGAPLLTVLSSAAAAAGPPDFMVTARYEFKGGAPFELADFIFAPGSVPVPAVPQQLAATLNHRIPPQLRDRPWTEAVDVTWVPAQPALITQPRPASYAIARIAPAPDPAGILLGKRGSGGYVPFVPARGQADPERNPDPSIIRYSDGNVPTPTNRAAGPYTYSVAAQDLFGRWSAWTSAAHAFGDDPVQSPAITSIAFEVLANGPAPTARSANLTVDFVWDWSDRTPATLEFTGGFLDVPPNAKANPPVVAPVPAGIQLRNTAGVGGALQIAFAGNTPSIPAPALAAFPGTSVVATDPIPPLPADPDLTPLPPPADPAHPDALRHYRLHVPNFVLDFASRDTLFFTAYVRGAEAVRPTLFGGWSQPATATAASPLAPVIPAVTDQIVWTSLRDHAGIARAHLTWAAAGGAAGYIVYTASESTLLGAAGLGAPDTTRSFHDRLARLRGLDMNALRVSFARVRKDAFPTNECEIELPKGSEVIHAFAVTATSASNVESAWPAAFIAVATPVIAQPGRPVLAVRAAAQAGVPVAHVTVEKRAGAPVVRFELYRVLKDHLATDVDTMGPPVASSTGAGWHTLTDADATLVQAAYTDTTIVPAWTAIWYRAVAWSADDLVGPLAGGRIGARSQASGAFPVVVPPATLPDVTDLRVRETGSTADHVLISWRSTAPILKTLLGSHSVTAIVTDPLLAATAPPTARFTVALDATPLVPDALHRPAFAAGGGPVFRQVVSGVLRYFAWVPRPVRSAPHAADTSPFAVAVALVDPLGRSSKLSAPQVTWT